MVSFNERYSSEKKGKHLVDTIVFQDLKIMALDLKIMSLTGQCLFPIVL